MNCFWRSASIRKLPLLCSKMKKCSPKILTLFVPAYTITKLSHGYVIPRAAALTASASLVLEEDDDSYLYTEPPFFVKRLVLAFNDAVYISKLCIRCISIVMLFIPPLVLLPMTVLHDALRHHWWQLFLYSIQRGGPVFTKFGQWVSTRRDIFSKEVCNYMTLLQHSTTPHAWRFTEQAMKEAFGDKWNEIFINFEDEPFGSGCIAQVYKSYMKKDALSTAPPHLKKWEWNMEKVKEYFKGHSYFRIYKSRNQISIPDTEGLVPVAVKVLHPGIKQKLEEDLSIIRAVAKCIERIIPRLRWLSLSECVEEFRSYMLSQIDMVQEAAMLDKFNTNFKGDSTVSFPRPIRPFISSGVLVETWEEGEPISVFIANGYPQSLKSKIADLGMTMLLKMIFVHNFVHGDMHPGNILVQNIEDSCNCRFPDDNIENTDGYVDLCDVVISDCNPRSNRSLKLVILDCGLVSLLPPDDFSKLYSVFRAVVMDRGEEVGELFLQHSVNLCDDPAAFKTGMKEIIDNAKHDSVTLGKVDVGRLLHSVFTLLTTNRVKLESNFLSVILAVMVLEGLGRSLNPNLDLMNKAKPYLISPLPHL